ncbi:type II CRISPR RNA-guided endonuclease Cas9 [Niabella digestorum]|uniref:CRISPR-associated endonuclease Cas9 n=1 Tax=Niabella digestorum TaxID=3117701 RepID=A0ABU7REC5_9BACT
MKNILGLDLGTNSIGWAHVIEEESPENSSIVQIGVRVNPLTTDEQTNFEKGKPITTNADRTLKRGMRRNLDRYQLRREHLIDALKKANIITAESKLAEDGKNTTHETWRLRAKAVSEKIEKDELARVLLAINKKRGYKSSRKAKNEEEGHAIDGMAIAKRLYEENLTPGQLSFQLLLEGKKKLPDFYRSDLQAEFDKVWNKQRAYYPDFLTEELYIALKGQGKENTRKRILAIANVYTADIKDMEDGLKNEKTITLSTREKKKLQAYKWRNDALTQQLSQEQVAFVLTEINNDINQSSGYLGEISDRSKELFFNKLTVGQYLYNQLLQNRHIRLKNQVFYRQDYMDEFEAIWEEQRKHHPELTDKLKEEIRDIIIFYQRKLKSQKGLISFCEFESKKVEINGKKSTIGARVAPKSSPLFQEFKIWQNLNNVLVRKKGSKKRKAQDTLTNFSEDAEVLELSLEAKETLFEELNLKGNLSSARIIEILGHKPADWEVNHTQLEGNRTNQALYNAYLKILEIEGYNEDLLKLSDKDDINVADLKTPAGEIKEMVKPIFEDLGIDTEILEFNAELDGKAFELQKSYQLWHLLYSAEDDDKKYSEEDILTYGQEHIGLKKKLCENFGFQPEHAKILVNVSFQDDYGSLSTKAMRKIYPYIKENKYSTACELAGYRHSKDSITKEENEQRVLKDKLELLPKNSLRNPVVEKILNQMINVVNALLDKNRKTDPNFKFDEIRIELARELKKNAKERAEMTSQINKAKGENEKIVEIIRKDFGILNPTRNDIVKYKLYQELAFNGYKDLYTNTKIDYHKLFSKEYDVDHIIPQSRLFDDSFSNKVLVPRQSNLDKGNNTAFDYMSRQSKEDFETYLSVVDNLYKEGKISKAKYQKLLKQESKIGDGFIERDLRDSQYIAKKAKEILNEIARHVVATSGSITDRLREDWGLINVMKEINLPKYRALGLTEFQERKDGNKVEVIKDWTKRNDHRHHAMDALTVAFTKRQYISYLNYLNARYNATHKEHHNIKGIEEKFIEWKYDDQGNKKRVFKLPIPNFRQQAKEHLESILVSHKAKNKVVTRNKNITKSKKGELVKIELTPRGQLHKETIYGKYHYYESKEVKIDGKFDEATIAMVAHPLYKKLLLERLQANDNDPKKAFTGKNALSKNPIYLDETRTETMPEKVKLTWLESDYAIRKDITPENFKDEKSLEKIIDHGVREILRQRLKEYGDAKKAFSDLDKNPIYHKNGQVIKRVRISGVKNAEPLHFKRDHLGNYLLDERGERIPVDFVSTGNNHHVAIYRDAKGNLQERVVSFMEAVLRKNYGLPLIFKNPIEDIDLVLNKGIKEELILSNLPEKDWEFLFTMKQNEMFVFPNDQTGFNPQGIDLLDPQNKNLISPNLFRVQKIANGDYWFRNHLETTVEAKSELKGVTYKRCSLIGIKGIIKVRINHLGDIVQVGEY